MDTERVRSLAERYGERFLSRWFAPREIEYCARKAKPHLHYAARLAAKEAAFKALGMSDGPLPWKDIVVDRDEAGRPRLVLEGRARAAADAAGAERLHLSISHCDAYATAVVTAERDGWS